MKRAFLIILAVFIFFTCAGGCGKSGSDEETESSPSSESSDSKEKSSSEGGSDSSSEGSEEDKKSGVITIEGSTSLQPLLTMAVGKFTESEEFKGAVIINGSDSIMGLKGADVGTLQIAMSDISPEQAGIDGSGLVDHQVAIVAIGVVVSKDVAANLSDISADDLKGIYSGAITDWQQVKGWKGGSVPVSVICRKSSSGTRYLFDTYGSGVKLTDDQIGALKNFKLLEASSEVYTSIENGQGAIGYLALPYCSGLKPVKIDGVEAKYEKVYSGEYKLWGCEHLYTKGEPKGPAKALVEFMTSEDFKESISKNGYGLISEMKVSR